MIVDTKRIKSFKSGDAFEKWLRAHHETEPELWLRVYKKGSGEPSVTIAEALDIVLCWGWIDGLKKSFDDKSFLQRYTPRTAKSTWSQINQAHVARLISAGRMMPPGQRQIEAAKKDGRWKAAYAPMREATHDNVPEDLRRAIAQNPKAQKFFLTLNRANLFALGFRVNQLKTAAARARKIESLVGMLARHETIIPMTSPRGKSG